MYILNSAEKFLTKIPTTSFNENNLKERADLQEWIDKNPEILDEDLLIIQKEFSGFDKTKERLDLLAIDKKGNLVLIENKLDDSGKDVTWQALKYVSYCSSLNKSQIIEIYQKYLLQNNKDLDAAEKIRDFLEKGSIEEVSLNTGHNQRIILIAREFRPEVTSTVLWLRGNNIDIQCVKIIPYKLGDDILIDIDKIIPVPETEEYMVRVSAKEIEEKNSSSIRNASENIYTEYWSKLLEFFLEKKFTLYENRTTSKDSWISAGSGISSISYVLVLLKSEIRVELYISRNSIEENKKIFESLLKNKESIEEEFGETLNWDKLENKKASRISISRIFERDNKDDWSVAMEWHYEKMKTFESVFKPYLLKIKENL